MTKSRVAFSITGIRPRTDSPKKNLLHNQTTLQAFSSGSPFQVQSSAALSGDKSIESSLNGAKTTSDFFVGNQTSQGESSANISAHPENLSKISDEGNNQTSQGKNSAKIKVYPPYVPKISEEELRLIAR
ncbi:hypothetical protein PanWU01x14_265600, partial [Parasponia andersonii]